MTVLPMFPLGLVLVPRMVLPLHVFEPRYRALMQDVLAGDGCFGVVLIERGHEVGGGDVRMRYGTRARILRAEELDDGRWIAVTVGTDRIRVQRWLEDDPYPRAEVDVMPEERAGPQAVPLRDGVATRLADVLALQAALGEGTGHPTDVSLAHDPVIASFQTVALADLTPLDAQQVLETDGVTDRLRLVSGLLDERADLLRFRLTE